MGPWHSAEATIPKRVQLSFGILILLMLTLVSVGGYVRLSGSGLSIPEWPQVNGSYLPPLNEADWITVRTAYDLDQDRLIELGRMRQPGLGSRGQLPEDLAEFKRMFLIEWSHRAIAALLGLVALLCLGQVLARPDLRRRAWRATTAIVLLIAFEILVGGILVKSGTATHWLFFHLSMATLILCTMLWSFFRTLGLKRVGTGRHERIRLLISLSLLLILAQIILGALVAGSRHNAPGLVVTWPLMLQQVVPPGLWNSQWTLAHNLLDNTLLHQWVHRWFAVLLLIQLGLLYRQAFKAKVPRPAADLLIASALLFAAQIAFGLTNVFLAAPIAIALIHLETALVIMALLTACFYLLGKPREAVLPLGAKSHAVPERSCYQHPLGRLEETLDH